jgi:hypothetical protein
MEVEKRYRMEEREDKEPGGRSEQNVDGPEANTPF